MSCVGVHTCQANSEFLLPDVHALQVRLGIIVLYKLCAYTPRHQGRIDEESTDLF